jgi:hypothetical protein
MIALLHRKILSTKAQWRTEPARRSLPPLSPVPWPEPRPLPYRGTSLEIRANASVWMARRQVAQLHPWQPVRILRNQRQAHHYTLEDYHLLLTGPHPPAELPPIRLIDLQLDRS